MVEWRKLREEVEQFGVTFVLAVSGGVDSMMLLDFFHNSKVSFVVAHFNHKIQPINEQMQSHVVDYCKARDIELHIGNGDDIVNKASIASSSVESEARRQRYDFLHEVGRKVTSREENSSSDKPLSFAIVTGHHLDDQVETVFINIMRGVGLQSCYIKRMNGRVYRPFIDISKEDLIASATKRNIPWIEDPSNTDTKMERNWLRNDIIPQLQARRNISKTIPLSIRKFEEYKDSFCG